MKSNQVWLFTLAFYERENFLYNTKMGMLLSEGGKSNRCESTGNKGNLYIKQSKSQPLQHKVLQTSPYLPSQSHWLWSISKNGDNLHCYRPSPALHKKARTAQYYFKACRHFIKSTTAAWEKSKRLPFSQLPKDTTVTLWATAYHLEISARYRKTFRREQFSWQSKL